MRPSPFELFHQTNQLESAAIRKLIQDLGLKEEFKFRDVDNSTDAGAFQERGGLVLPAIWTGDEFIYGRQDIEKYLHWATQEPFPELLERFDEIANSVWDDLKKLIPDEFKEPIEKIQFWILDEPTPELLAGLPKETADNFEELCGLHEGTPMTMGSVTYPDYVPVRVYLFRWAHMDFLWPEDGNPEQILREEIAVTILHEIGHYFGLSEDDLERLGYE